MWGSYDPITNHYLDSAGLSSEPWNHRITPLVDFGSLLREANCFPNGSSSRIERSIPAMRNSVQGFVSLLNVDHLPCQDPELSLNNAVTGAEKRNSNPGQNLLTNRRAAAS